MAGSSSPLSDSLESCDSPEEEPSKSKNPGAEGGKQRKKFHPFRAVRNIFRRAKRQGSEDDSQLHSSTSKKSRSTSELSTSTSGQGSSPTEDVHLGRYRASGDLHPHGSVGNGGGHGLQLSHAGLSVSHDSIFASEHSAAVSSGTSLQDASGGSGQQGSALSVHNEAGLKGFREELRARFRNRRDSDDEDDPGLPRSPCTSPTTADILAQGLKDKSSKSHSTCSAGSLISMCSSENDEDLVAMFSSSHSSSRRSGEFDGELDVSQPVPLNHEAALHKMAVRPKRTHGLPRHRRMQQMALAGVGQSLPATPEVTEDSSLQQLVLLAAPEENTIPPPLEDIIPAPEISETILEPTPTSIYCADVTSTAASIEPVAEMKEEANVSAETEAPAEIIPAAEIVEPSVEVGTLEAPTTSTVNTEHSETSQPLVKTNKGKSKSAELKLRHEIRQFSKRQQEKMRSVNDPPEMGPDDIELQGDFILVQVVTEPVQVVGSSDRLPDEDAHSYVDEDFTNGNVDVIEPEATPQVEQPVKKENETVPDSHSRTSEVSENKEQETVMEVQTSNTDPVGQKFNTAVELQEANKQVVDTQVAKHLEPEHIQNEKVEIIVDTPSAMNSTPIVSMDDLEGVVLRHPEKLATEKSPERTSHTVNHEKPIEKHTVEIESMKSDSDVHSKPVEHAFSSGDFAGIMKKRRSVTDSSVLGDSPASIPIRPVSEMLAKPATPSKRLSVEIATFDQRSKEQSSKPDTKQDSGKSSPNPEVEYQKKQEPVQENVPQQCPPVTIRIRRGKSLVERYSESSVEVTKPDVSKPLEKPLFRPRSQIVNQSEPNSKVPEFMKIQLRSSREELDVSSKAEPAPTNQQPQWEVKIQPQVNQRRQSAGPNSLPSLATKAATSDQKPEVQKTPASREVKIESLADKDLQLAVKVETKDDDVRSKLPEEKVKQEDISKGRRHSSENKENVASSNVQREIIERKVSVEELKQDVVVERTSVPDIRRRSFVQVKDNEDHEPELLRVFARRSYKQKSSDKTKKEEGTKEEAKPSTKTDQNIHLKPEMKPAKPEVSRTPLPEVISRTPAKPEVSKTPAKPEMSKTPAKPEVSRTPAKPKSETKPTANDKTPQKHEDVQKQVSKEQPKHPTPVKIQISELPTPKSHSGPISPKPQSPDISSAKPERRESLNFRVRPSEATSKPSPQSPKVQSDSSVSKAPAKETPSFTPSKLERKESSSFKVKSSESNHSYQNKGTDKGQSPELASSRSQVAAVKRGEFVKMASVDSPGAVKEKDGGKDAPTWLQLAQQRREKREQKERLLYGQNSNTCLIEGTSRPSRNSKVLDLVNNFQKLQTT